MLSLKESEGNGNERIRKPESRRRELGKCGDRMWGQKYGDGMWEAPQVPNEGDSAPEVPPSALVSALEL